MSSIGIALWTSVYQPTANIKCNEAAALLLQGYFIATYEMVSEI